MFIKEKQPKKKRQLTEKQLAGLAKGREKMAEKRRLKKELTSKKKELEKLDTKAVKDNQKEAKTTRKEKKKVLEEQEEYLLKKSMGDKSSNKFIKLKTGAIGNLKSTEELYEFEKIMSGVSKDMERNPEELYKYLREHGDRLIGKTKEKLRPIKEEPEEKKPSIKLSIDEL